MGVARGRGGKDKGRQLTSPLPRDSKERKKPEERSSDNDGQDEKVERTKE